MADRIDALKSLHTALIDRRKGYEEALEAAEGRGLTPLFREMVAMRFEHADQLAGLLTAADEKVDDDGSFMAIVHRAVISVRSAVTGLDESILPGLIDGEALPSDLDVLNAQRRAVDRKIENMKQHRVAG